MTTTMYKGAKLCIPGQVLQHVERRDIEIHMISKTQSPLLGEIMCTYPKMYVPASLRSITEEMYISRNIPLPPNGVSEFDIKRQWSIPVKDTFKDSFHVPLCQFEALVFKDAPAPKKKSQQKSVRIRPMGPSASSSISDNGDVITVRRVRDAEGGSDALGSAIATSQGEGMKYSCPFEMYQEWWHKQTRFGGIATALSGWDNLPDTLQHTDRRKNCIVSNQCRNYWILAFEKWCKDLIKDQLYEIEYYDTDGTLTLIDPDHAALTEASSASEFDQTLQEALWALRDGTSDPSLRPSCYGTIVIDISLLPISEWNEFSIRTFLRRYDRYESFDRDPVLLGIEKEELLYGGNNRRFLCRFEIPELQQQQQQEEEEESINNSEDEKKKSLLIWVFHIDVGQNPTWRVILKLWETETMNDVKGWTKDSSARVRHLTEDESSKIMGKVTSKDDETNTKKNMIPRAYQGLKLLCGKQPPDSLLKDLKDQNSDHILNSDMEALLSVGSKVSMDRHHPSVNLAHCTSKALPVLQKPISIRRKKTGTGAKRVNNKG